MRCSLTSSTWKCTFHVSYFCRCSWSVCSLGVLMSQESMVSSKLKTLSTDSILPINLGQPAWSQNSVSCSLWPAMYMLQPNGQLCTCCSPMACAVNVSMIMHACLRWMGKVGHMTPDLSYFSVQLDATLVWYLHMHMLLHLWSWVQTGTEPDEHVWMCVS